MRTKAKLRIASEHRRLWIAEEPPVMGVYDVREHTALRVTHEATGISRIPAAIDGQALQPVCASHTLARLRDADGGVVQRKFNLDGKLVEIRRRAGWAILEGQEADDEAAEYELNERRAEDAVQAYLTHYGIPYYLSYGTAAINLIKSAETFTYDGKDGAVALSRKLGEATAKEFEENPDDIQDSVQRKLIEISQLYWTQLQRAEGAAAIITPQIRAWYGKLIDNGLCFGFVKIYEQHPAWLMALWNAIRAWTPPHGKTIDEAIDELNDHIEEHMAFADGKDADNIKEAILLAQEAWNAMDEQDLGLDEAYGAPPEHIDAVRGTPAAHGIETLGEKEWDASTVEKGQRWPAVGAFITQTIGENLGTYHIDVSHEGHQMAIAVQRLQDQPERLFVVETLGSGMIPCASWLAVGAAIAPRLAEAESEFDVTVKRQT